MINNGYMISFSTASSTFIKVELLIKHTGNFSMIFNMNLIKFTLINEKNICRGLIQYC